MRRLEVMKGGWHGRIIWNNSSEESLMLGLCLLNCQGRNQLNLLWSQAPSCLKHAVYISQVKAPSSLGCAFYSLEYLVQYLATNCCYYLL